MKARPIAVVLVLSVIVAALGIFVQQSAVAQSGDVWSDASANRIAAMGRRQITPDRFRLVMLNAPRLRTLLEAKVRSRELMLPAPDGTMRRYRFEAASVMAPELAARFPEIRTYKGAGVDDPRESVRFDWTPAGFHAMVTSRDGATYYIDPYQTGDVASYMSYYRRDLTKKIGHDEWTCGVQDAPDEAELREELAQIAQRSSGTQMRKYRLALAATGEYVAYHASAAGATTEAQKKAAALAAMVTTMHRVNGVYESEVGITMELISSTTNVIFTNGATDPYTNDDGFSMLDQNQATIDSVIGSANYDIGHVFSTGGGGVAYLGVPCVSGYKARGVTGSRAPVGDPFDVDYVAHEMGHQFGADHTFNSVSRFCGGGNRTASSAYEPGSGSTIMAYAGICSPENLQPNSDPHFHSRSFDQILDYTVDGDGDRCAVTTSTGNQPPTVDAGGTYTIPARTPFFMTGSAADPDGGSLTYDWQQYDLGSATSSNATTTSDDGARPLFRVFNPTTSPTRYFPRMQDVLAGTASYGEGMPTTSRTLNFRLVVRDGDTGAAYDETFVTTHDTGAAFAVTDPTGAISWQTGNDRTVTWNVAGTTAAPISCALVDIRQSRDGGATFPFLTAARTPNDGSESVTLRGAPTSQGRIKVTCAGSIFFNVSQGNFTALDGPYLTSASTSSGSTAGGTRLTLSGDNLSGATSARVGATPVDVEVLSNAQVVITTPAGAAGAVYSVSVQTPSGNAILDEAFEYVDMGTPTPTPTTEPPPTVEPTPTVEPPTPTPTATPMPPPDTVVVDGAGGVLSSGGVTITIPPQTGEALTVTLTSVMPTAPPSGAQLRAFVLSAAAASGAVNELTDAMTFLLTYEDGQVTGANVPQLFVRSAGRRGATSGWERVPADVDLDARTVTAQATRMTEYVLVAAPVVRIYVPVAVNE